MSIGTVQLVGNWFDVTFAHDLRVSHALRRVEGLRVGTGHWRVPAANGAALARGLQAFDLRWEGAAADVWEEEVVASRDWHVENARALAIKQSGVQSPTDIPVDLLPHQQSGAAFLAARSGALLCDEQGLGKTLTCLSALWFVRASNPATRLLVVCPNSLKFVWQREVERFFPDWTVQVIQGSAAQRARCYRARADIYVANYEAARSDRSEVRWLLRMNPTILVCDEAHALKNGMAQTTRALQFARAAATRAWLMTGTPVPNKVDDIYSQVTLADNGRTFGTMASFLSRFGRAAQDPTVLANLTATLDPIILRRTKDEVLDLPERTFEERHVELKGRQRQMYDEMRDGILETVQGMSEAEFAAQHQNVLVRLLRLSQIASNPRLVDPEFVGVPAKVSEIDDLLRQLIDANGRKVVLWSYYVQTIEELLHRYRRYDPVAIYGGIDIDSRGEAVRRFQEDDSTMLFIGNPQAAGTGLTLTAAPYAIYETLSWRYDLYAQSLDRIHRIGQQRNVTYFEILAEDSIDLRMKERLGEKQQFASELLGDTSATPRLTRDDVLGLLRPGGS